ncbi:MAG: proprotein convertase P-domain-containing protein [Flavobacteriales bacterium]
MKPLYNSLILVALFLGGYTLGNAQCFVAVADNTPIQIDGADTSTPSCEFSANVATIDLTGSTSIIGVDIEASGGPSISISHTYSSDLDIVLVSPAGTELVLASNLGGPSNDAYLNTSFVNSGTNITNATAPFSGSYVPQGGCFDAVFNGESLDGVWSLRVCDNYNNDSGVIEDFTMSFCAILDGCLDPTACNFSPLGNGDPCVYPVYAIPTDTDDFGPVISVCPDAVPFGYVIASDQCCVQARIDADAYCLNFFWDNLCNNGYLSCIGDGLGCNVIGGCTDKCAPNFNSEATEDDGSCEVYETCPENDCFGIFEWDTSTCSCQAIIIDYFCDDEDACTFDFVDPTTCLCVFEEIDGCRVPGCTYPSACNYNVEATEDDGSCSFGEQAYFIPVEVAGIAPIISACSGSVIEGYVESPNQCCVQERIDNDSYCIETDWDNLCNNAYLNCLATSVECNSLPGCTDQCAPNYNADATEDDGSCETYEQCPENNCFSIYTWDPETCSCQEAIIDYFCDDFNACTFDYIDTELCVCVNAPIDGCGLDVLGCTYPESCNYDPSATLDDGSCEEAGCTDSFALNYDPDAACDTWPSLCVYNSNCPGDFNNDLQISVADLSGFLGVFGTTCALPGLD